MGSVQIWAGWTLKRRQAWIDLLLDFSLVAGRLRYVQLHSFASSAKDWHARPNFRFRVLLPARFMVHS